MAKRRRPKPRKNPAKVTPSRTVRATLETSVLEVAKGYDGLFRGEPEPVLLCGLFAAGRLLAREQIAFTRAGASPRTLVPATPHVGKARLPPTARSLTLLYVAIEEDGGDAVRSMYSALERPLRAWRPGDAVPQPLELEDPEWLAAGGAPQPVEILLDGTEWRALLRGDDLVAAAVVAVPTERAAHELRVPFVSADGKNEWTARAALVLA